MFHRRHTYLTSETKSSYHQSSLSQSHVSGAVLTKSGRHFRIVAQLTANSWLKSRSPTLQATPNMSSPTRLHPAARRSARVRQLQATKADPDVDAAEHEPTPVPRTRKPGRPRRQEEDERNPPLKQKGNDEDNDAAVPAVEAGGHDAVAAAAAAVEPAVEATEASEARPPKRARVPAPAKRAKGSESGAKRAAGPTRDLEVQIMADGYHSVGGADEAGRGPLAGPVVAAVVVLPPPSDPSWTLPAGLNDSKAISEEEREAIYAALTTDPRVKWAVSVIEHDEIDRINILQAALGAMRRSAETLLREHGVRGGDGGGGGDPKPPLDFLLVDGNRMPKDLPVAGRTVVKGDATCCCIAAASCIAKVTRDRLMLKLDTLYSQYGFAQHKGYGVPAHMEALRTHGPCVEHRRSFEPVKTMTGWTRPPPERPAAAGADEEGGSGKGAAGRGKGKGAGRVVKGKGKARAGAEEGEEHEEAVGEEAKRDAVSMDGAAAEEKQQQPRKKTASGRGRAKKE